MASDEEIIRTMKVSMSMARDLGLEISDGPEFRITRGHHQVLYSSESIHAIHGFLAGFGRIYDESQDDSGEKSITKSCLNDIPFLEKLWEEAKNARPVELTKSLVIQNLIVALGHHLLYLKQRGKRSDT